MSIELKPNQFVIEIIEPQKVISGEIPAEIKFVPTGRKQEDMDPAAFQILAEILLSATYNDNHAAVEE